MASVADVTFKNCSAVVFFDTHGSYPRASGLPSLKRVNNITHFPKALVHSFMDHAADGCSRDEVLGPPLCRIYERSAVGPLPPDAPGPPSLGVFARRASKMLGWWVRGLGRPTPFFDDRTKAPRAVPRVLTQSDRTAL
jgi:hypothetical protein